MREIKFRGKLVKNDIWVYGYYFWSEKEDKHYIIGESIDYGFNKMEVDPKTVGEYTGLKDKNGKEIYEVDIVKDLNGDVGYIVYLLQECGYQIVFKKYDVRLGHRHRREGHHLEIIGNIRENPELLEVSS